MSERVYAGESAADRQARRRRQLLDAGLELFGTQGYRATTVRQVCREAAVADRYFYQELPGLEDLLLAVYDECIGRLMGAASEAVAGQTDVEAMALAGLGAFLEVVEADPRLARVVWFEVLGVSPRVEATYLARMDAFGRLILELLADRDRVGDQDAASLDLLAATAVGGVSHAVLTWVSRGFDPPREQLVAVLARFLAGASGALA